MVKAADFIKGDYDIQWVKLATTIVGGTVLAWFTGVIELVLTVYRQVAGLFGGIATFLEAFIEDLIAAPVQTIGQAWQQLASGFGSIGPFTFAGSLVAILAVMWVVEKAVSRYG